MRLTPTTHDSLRSTIRSITGKFIELAQMGHVWDSWIDILRFAGDEDPKLLDRLWGLSPEWSKEGIHPDAFIRNVLKG